MLVIDWDYLYIWGHYRLMVDMHERLEGKIDEPVLRIISLGTLGSAFATGGTIISYGNMFELVPIPEPSTFLLMGSGLVGLASLRYKLLRFRLPRAEGPHE